MADVIRKLLASKRFPCEYVKDFSMKNKKLYLTENRSLVISTALNKCTSMAEQNSPEWSPAGSSCRDWRAIIIMKANFYVFRRGTTVCVSTVYECVSTVYVDTPIKNWMQFPLPLIVGKCPCG